MEVVDILRSRILSRELRPGERLHTEQLAKGLGVSRVPVREAFLVLENEGLVRTVVNTGTWVSSYDADELRSIFAIRMQLESLALEQSIPLSDESQLRRLDELLREMPQAETMMEFLELDTEFHQLCYGAVKYEPLVRLIAQQRNLMHSYTMIWSRFFTNHVEWQAHVEHRMIVEAIKAKDASLAAALLRAHYTTACNQLLECKEIFG